MYDVGAATDNSFHFDAELVETVINKMKLGKAAGLDGLTAEHLQYSSMCVIETVQLYDGYRPCTY